MPSASPVSRLEGRIDQSTLLTQTVGRLLIASIPFPIRVGEMAVYARKR